MLSARTEHLLAALAGEDHREEPRARDAAPVELAEHDGEFCDCGGNGSCEKWAWAGEMADQKACEAKANKLGASCFDYNGPRMDESDVDLAPPAGNITGPVGEVWVTHTALDRHMFGVAMAAMLRNDYTLSLGEQPPAPAQLAASRELVRVGELRMLLLPAGSA